MKKNVLFSICSLGMGHATRSLPVIKKFLDNYNVYIISTGDALNFLKGELGSRPIKFFKLEDYPPLQRGRGVLFYLYLIYDLINTVLIIKRENDFIKKIIKEYDINLIISDGRYGAFSKDVPCFLISHQIKLLVPKSLRLFQPLVDSFNVYIFNRFDRILIPDYGHAKHSLAGKMSHNKLIRKIKCHYVGILSSYYDLHLAADIDYLFVISGFLEEQKKNFISQLVNQSRELPGKKVFVLGDTSREYHKIDVKNNIEIFSYALGQKKIELFNRAKFIISRSGYTTIMDLVETDKKALLVPTKNQVEQEYLGSYLKKNKYFLTSDSETKVNLKEILANDYQENKFVPRWKTSESVVRIEKAINECYHENFFSIVIPAHNEAKVIVRTLKYLEELNYPKYKYEVIVVENGSSDSTYDLARSQAEEFIKVYSLDKGGVSMARNFGLKQTSTKSDWVIFLDADTFLKADFLFSLNEYLIKNKRRKLAVGTSYVMPNPTSVKARYWFRFYNLGHKLTKSSFALQIIKKSITRYVNYDENLTFSEDLKFLTDAQKYGEFFCFETDQVLTSTRRFEEEGWLTLFVKWNIEAILPGIIKKKLNYKVIR